MCVIIGIMSQEKHPASFSCNKICVRKFIWQKNLLLLSVKVAIIVTYYNGMSYSATTGW